MPCMCGDPCCSSCGPLQGNWRCPICRVWASENCIHIDNERSEIKEKYKIVAEQILREEAEADEILAKGWEEDQKLAKEWKSGNHS